MFREAGRAGGAVKLVEVAIVGVWVDLTSALVQMSDSLLVLFFFQAEGGIRDIGVTGVQTCALPICVRIGVPTEIKEAEYRVALTPAGARELSLAGHEVLIQSGAGEGSSLTDADYVRSEERRVGKECRSRWSPYH